MKEVRIGFVLLAVAVVLCGCKKQAPPPQPKPQDTEVRQPAPKPSPAPEPVTESKPVTAGVWTVQKFATIETGLVAPESILPDPVSGQIYVSNIDTQSEAYWEDDGKGFISIIAPDGAVKTLKWLESRPQATMNAPKGMCVLNGKLYFTDNTRLKRCNAQTGADPERFMDLKGQQFNDLATDGTHIWMTDTQAGTIYRIDEEGQYTEVKSPPSVNGITCWQGKVFAVSWGEHDIYEIDPEGEQEPQAFGLAAEFKTLDGIEFLEDGTCIVSDFEGGKVCAVLPDRKTIVTLAELETPADIGIDQNAGILFVPQLKANKATLYKITKK
ncbi:MAG: hypothetical protein JW828_16825 [Sedimentisphaerales bacterium]|nr:hypothetical protein [Sedimentisphaerales bacterium]